MDLFTGEVEPQGEVESYPARITAWVLIGCVGAGIGLLACLGLVCVAYFLILWISGSPR